MVWRHCAPIFVEKNWNKEAPRERVYSRNKLPTNKRLFKFDCNDVICKAIRELTVDNSKCYKHK
jgi:hypothetical protein